MDYYHVKDNSQKNRQKQVFERMIELAGEVSKPLVVHARDSEREAYEMVKNTDIPVVFHCFSGDIKTMKMFEDSGYFISISTMICFSEKHKKLAEKINMDYLLLETDSPFLSPRRGRNEPAYLWDSVEVLSSITGYPHEEICQAVLNNVSKIFKI